MHSGHAYAYQAQGPESPSEGSRPPTMTLHLSNFMQPTTKYNYERQGGSSSVNTTNHNMCTATNNTMYMPPQPMIMVRQGADESGFYSQNDFDNGGTRKQVGMT